MGTCGSGDDKGKRNKKSGNDKNPFENNQKEINTEIKEINEDNNIKLKGTPKILNHLKQKYKYKLTNLSTNESYEKEIEGDNKINELITSLNLRANGDFIIEFQNSIKIGYDKINENFQDIITEVFNKDIPDIIEMNYSYKGLDIPGNMDNIMKAYIESNFIIGSAILDNPEFLSIITYEKNTENLQPYFYKRKDNEDLLKFNLFTAFCNAKGNLYFSGGETEETYDPDKSIAKYNDFFYIDLTKLNDNKNKIIINELPNLNESRTWHSMIYVPYKYIFIVGGSNTKSVEIYNIETNEINKDSELNNYRSECTLCLVNNEYLYAFCGFLLHNEFNSSIEKCNLLKEERQWELVNINENNGLIFKPSFFGVSYFRNYNEILLIGGNDNGDEKHFDYLYKIGKNEEDKDEIKTFKSNLNENNVVYRDKLFMLVGDNKSVNIPLIIGEDIKIFVLDLNNGEISTQYYEGDSISNLINF